VYGAFLFAREAVLDMLELRAGAIIFTGATSSVRGRGGAVAFSSAKFAVRGLAQSLAVELWPKGIPVADVIIDGVIVTPYMQKQKFRNQCNRTRCLNIWKRGRRNRHDHNA